MAGIDKIYGTVEQWDELSAWCAEHVPDALPHFYQRDGYENPEHPLTNFPKRIDRAVLSHPECLPWVAECIREQYGSSVDDLLNPPDFGDLVERLDQVYVDLMKDAAAINEATQGNMSPTQIWVVRYLKMSASRLLDAIREIREV